MRERTRAPQKRGLERRKKLLEAARRLLAEMQLSEISYQDIAEEAGMPLTSCYHFYANKLELVRELADYTTPMFYQEVFQPFDETVCGRWQDIVRTMVMRATAYFNSKPAERLLFLGGQMPPEVRLESKIRERAIGIKFKEVLEKHFVLPEIPDYSRVFFNSIEISTLLFSLGQMERGDLGTAVADDAADAQVAYLSLYIPAVLKRREAALSS